MKVRYTGTAAADLDDILSYLNRRNPRAAADVAIAVAATVSRIAEFPNSAQATDEPRVRMATVGRFPYLVFYTAEEDEVRIIRVLHGARLRPWDYG